MTSKLVRFLMFTVLAVSVATLAQTLPAAPSAAANNAEASAANAAVNATGTRMGTVNVEQAIFATNEGQRDFEALSKKLEPKQTELKNQNDEVESLKKQLNTQGDKLNEDSRATLVKHGAELPTSPKQVLAWRADKEAKKALLVGGAENVERAVRFCQLKEALGFQSGSFCTNVAAGVSKAP